MSIGPPSPAIMAFAAKSLSMTRSPEARITWRPSSWHFVPPAHVLPGTSKMRSVRLFCSSTFSECPIRNASS